MLIGLIYCALISSIFKFEFFFFSRANPAHKQAWLNLLVLLDETNNCEEAVSLADTVLQYHSKDASVLSQLGTCYGKLGQYGSAEKFLLSAVELEPTTISYWKNIGRLIY